MTNLLVKPRPALVRPRRSAAPWVWENAKRIIPCWSADMRDLVTGDLPSAQSTTDNPKIINGQWGSSIRVDDTGSGYMYYPASFDHSNVTVFMVGRLDLDGAFVEAICGFRTDTLSRYWALAGQNLGYKRVYINESGPATLQATSSISNAEPVQGNELVVLVAVGAPGGSIHYRWGSTSGYAKSSFSSGTNNFTTNPHNRFVMAGQSANHDWHLAGWVADAWSEAQVKAFISDPSACIRPDDSQWIAGWAPAGGGDITVTPDPVSATGSTADPAVVLGSVAVTPAPASASGSTVDPAAVLGSVAVTPAPASASGSTVDPAVVLGSVAVTAPPASAAGSTVDPAVVLGSVAVTPAPASATGSTVDPAVSVGGGVTVTPAPASATGSTVDPAVVLGSVAVTPAAASATGSTVDPAVSEGGKVTVTPAPASAAGSTVDPTVVLGSVAVTPSPAAAAAVTVGPNVVLGGGTIVTPAPASATGSTADPTVVRGSLVFTVVSAARGSTTGPVVVLGSTVATPQAAAAVASTVGPMVSDGGAVGFAAGDIDARPAVSANCNLAPAVSGDVRIRRSAS